MIEKIFLACDHAGLPLKKAILESYRSAPLTGSARREYDWQDLGTMNDSSVDYPDYADRVALELKKNPKAMGVLICGSGQGMAIRANRHKHIRAALCWNEEIAKLSRAHNNANVLCMGARFIEPTLALNILNSFLMTDFEGGRHANRVNKLNQEC